MDEFEKVDRDVWEGFLNAFDKGEWTDKQLKVGAGGQTNTVDCSNCIFVLTTNALDHEVFSFEHAFKDLIVGARCAGEMPNLRTQLRSYMKQSIIHKFIMPLEGRIDALIPFFQFTRQEQVVIAEAKAEELQVLYRKPADETEKRFVGQVCWLQSDSNLDLDILTQY